MITIQIPALSQARADHTRLLESFKKYFTDDNRHHDTTQLIFSKYAYGIGPWLYAHALVVYQDVIQLESIEHTHAIIYGLASEMVQCITSGQIRQAGQIFEQILILDRKMNELLDPFEIQLKTLEGTSLMPRYYSSGNINPQSRVVCGPQTEPGMPLASQVDICALTEHTDVLILFSDQSGSIFYVNAAWILATGRPLESVAANSWTSLLHQSDSQAVSNMAAQALLEKKTLSCECRMCGKGLEDQYYLLKISPWFEKSEDFKGCIITLTNIDQLKKASLENHIKSAVLDRCELIIGISLLDPMPKPLYNNLYTLNKLGWESGKGKTLLDAVYPDDRSAVLSLLPELIANKGGSHEIRLYNKNTQEPFWVQWNAMVIEEPGFPAILATISPDITQRKQDHQVLQQRQGDLLNALEIAHLGTWEMDVDTRKTRFSQRHLDMFGVISDSMTLQQAISHVVVRDRERLSDAFFSVLQTGSDGKFESEYSILNASTGKEQVIHSLGQAYFDADGKAVRIAGIAQDITIYRNLQQSLEIQVQQRTLELNHSNKQLAESHHKMKQANQQLSKSNEDLQRFAYVASHDLQEPLRKIQQFSGRLQLEFVSASSREKDFLNRLSAAAGRMSILIDDLLAFSRISNDIQEMRLVSLNKVVAQVASDLDVRIAEAGATLVIDELPSLRGNALQLGQLFQNLISNALKFHRITSEGKIIPPHIHVSSRLMDPGDLPRAVIPLIAVQSYYKISVQDNGIGFDEIYLDRIFQVFQRLHGKSEYSGTGIGLAICERVAANHAGAISAESQLGKGAVFSLYIPIE